MRNEPEALTVPVLDTLERRIVDAVDIVRSENPMDAHAVLTDAAALARRHGLETVFVWLSAAARSLGDPKETEWRAERATRGILYAYRHLARHGKDA